MGEHKLQLTPPQTKLQECHGWGYLEMSIQMTDVSAVPEEILVDILFLN
jgi:hypothetical protein